MIEPAAGVLLISDPFLKDPNFMRSVVFLCEHNENGTFGFVLNRKYENTLDELLPDLEGYALPLYYGGPVQMDSIHFIHQCPDKIPGGQEIMKGIWWGGDFEAVIDLLKERRIEPHEIRFYIGYSGWGEGQLNEEMKDKSWLCVKATKKILFHDNTTEVWKDSLRLMGGDYEMMINFPIDPQLN